MAFTHNSRAFEYLRQGVASARSAEELTRMRRLARAHYSGLLLMEMEEEIERRARELDHAAERLKSRDAVESGG